MVAPGTRLLAVLLLAPLLAAFALPAAGDCCGHDVDDPDLGACGPCEGDEHGHDEDAAGLAFHADRDGDHADHSCACPCHQPRTATASGLATPLPAPRTPRDADPADALAAGYHDLTKPPPRA